jgi:hypothetical protein
MKRSNEYPLRRVVDHQGRREYQGVQIDAVELECGHKLSPPEDFRGRRYPDRMRCRLCAKEEAELEAEAERLRLDLSGVKATSPATVSDPPLSREGQ